MRYAHTLATIVAVFASTLTAAAEPVKVPLSDVWAYRMPGTKDISGLELGPFDSKSFVGWGFEEFSRMREDAITNIVLTLQRKIPSESASQGFAVPWQGDAIALRTMSQTLMAAMQDKPVLGRPKDDAKTTLLFFSHPCSYYVQLSGVERDDKVITVRYQFVPHKTAESTVHFALIPLGTLPAGEYQVRFEQVPMDKKFHEDGFIAPSTQQVRRTICQSFTFTVEEAMPAEVSDSGDDIALNKIWALQMPGTRDVRELGSDNAARIRVWLTERTAERAKAGPCFLVKGEGKDALANAAKVLVDGEAPMDRIPAGEVVTLVFYAYSAPGYVAVKSVRDSSEHVTIKYEVVTHQTSNATVHFALIPLGKLSPGNLTVNLVEIHNGGPEQYPEVKERAICDSCSFVVQ